MTLAQRPLAVVTGASSGIGAALAVVLARDGYDLMLVARRAELLHDVARRITRDVPTANVDVFVLDITTPGAAAAVIARASHAQLVVNNAGFGIVGKAIDVDDEAYRRMIALNVTALTELTLGYARVMPSGATIVNIASMAGLVPIPYQCVYAATKAYVVSFSEALHFELRPRGVSVLAFCPGPTLTEANEIDGPGRRLAEGRRMFFHTAHAVAMLAARAAREQDESAVPGVLNRIGAALLRILPRSVGRWAVAKAYAQVASAP